MTEHMQFTKDQLIEAALEYQGLLQRRVRNGDDEEWTRDSRLHIKLTEIALAALTSAPVVPDAMPVPNYDLFVQGVIADGENRIYADDDQAHYFTVYRQNADGTTEPLMDFTNRVNALWAISLVKKLNKQANMKTVADEAVTLKQAASNKEQP